MLRSKRMLSKKFRNSRMHLTWLKTTKRMANKSPRNKGSTGKISLKMKRKDCRKKIRWKNSLKKRWKCRSLRRRRPASRSSGPKTATMTPSSRSEVWTQSLTSNRWYLTEKWTESKMRWDKCKASLKGTSGALSTETFMRKRTSA